MLNCDGTFEFEDGRTIMEDVLHIKVHGSATDDDIKRYSKKHVEYVEVRANTIPVRPFSMIYDLTEIDSMLSPIQIHDIVKIHNRCAEMYKKALTCTAIFMSNDIVRTAINAVLQPPIYRPVRPLKFLPSLGDPETIKFFHDSRKAAFSRPEDHATR